MHLKYNDRQHAYWLDGSRCKGVTTVAKIPDDTYNLDQWRKRMRRPRHGHQPRAG